uniref:Uncharacterized protein n=1 Tax=Cucumis melo TaxID=3656 RepID=A0A9I9EIG7_CUCME
MGNCFSNEAVGQSSIGGTAFSQSTTSNVAIDCFLLSRGYRGLYSQIELSFSASNLRDRDIFSKVLKRPLILLFRFLFIGLKDQILEARADILVTSSYQFSFSRKQDVVAELRRTKFNLSVKCKIQRFKTEHSSVPLKGTMAAHVTFACRNVWSRSIARRGVTSSML